MLLTKLCLLTTIVATALAGWFVPIEISITATGPVSYYVFCVGNFVTLLTAAFVDGLRLIELLPLVGLAIWTTFDYVKHWTLGVLIVVAAIGALSSRSRGRGARPSTRGHPSTSVLLLVGPETRYGPVEEAIRAAGDDVTIVSTRLPNDPEAFLEPFDCAVSYGYRFLVRPPAIDRFPKRIWNLHISFLPHCRGADPNLWSFLEGCPKGVTIHEMDEGLDTGPIVAQKEVDFGDLEAHTFASTYRILNEEICALFSRTWPELRTFDQAERIPNRTEDAPLSQHRSADKERFVKDVLPRGWDTPVAQAIRAYAVWCDVDQGSIFWDKYNAEIVREQE